jgi:gamma-glutamyltranspeptidase/glutathione hydrolase
LELERGSPLAALAGDLRALGHDPVESDLVSGLQGIAVGRDGDARRLSGGADPRREGDVAGD